MAAVSNVEPNTVEPNSKDKTNIHPAVIYANNGKYIELIAFDEGERFLIYWVACYRVGFLCTQAKADPCFFIPWFTFSAPF